MKDLPGLQFLIHISCHHFYYQDDMMCLHDYQHDDDDEDDGENADDGTNGDAGDANIATSECGNEPLAADPFPILRPPGFPSGPPWTPAESTSAGDGRTYTRPRL